MRRIAALLLVALLLAGCMSIGEAYQASSVSFAAAVDTATELRKAGKLDAGQVAAVNSLVNEGSKALHSWAEKVKAGQDDPESESLLQALVDKLRALLVKKKE